MRLVPDVPLPPYTYVPGQAPHPFSDPAGHRFGLDLPAPPPPDPERWRESRHYLLGIDLFNHGFYWEAHELWEKLWHACGRRGTMAAFFKGLIQLAVVGVKLREGRADGAITHARRAAELFEQVHAETGHDEMLGLSCRELIDAARRAEQEGSLQLVLRPVL